MAVDLRHVDIRHKGLRRFAETRDTRGILSDQVKKIDFILTFLASLSTPDDVKQTNFGLHKLRGDLKGYYAVKVNMNWRIIFQFDGKNVYNVDLIDYH